MTYRQECCSVVRFIFASVAVNEWKSTEMAKEFMKRRFESIHSALAWSRSTKKFRARLPVTLPSSSGKVPHKFRRHAVAGDHLVVRLLLLPARRMVQVLWTFSLVRFSAALQQHFANLRHASLFAVSNIFQSLPEFGIHAYTKKNPSGHEGMIEAETKFLQEKTLDTQVSWCFY